MLWAGPGRGATGHDGFSRIRDDPVESKVQYYSHHRSPGGGRKAFRGRPCPGAPGATGGLCGGPGIWWRFSGIAPLYVSAGCAGGDGGRCQKKGGVYLPCDPVDKADPCPGRPWPGGGPGAG